MAFPSTALDIQVQIALGADLTAFPTSWTWTTVTTYALVPSGIVITRGRSDQYAEMPPSTCRLAVRNDDGRWCRTNPVGAWYGQLTKNTPLRVRVNVGAGYVTRFTGFIDELPPRWDKSGRYAVAEITASGVLRRIGRGGPLRSALFRAHTNGYFSSGDAVAYWPCEDDSGARSIASGVGGRAAVFTGISLAGDSSIPGSNPLPTLTASGSIVGFVPTYTAATSWCLVWVMKIPTEPGSDTPLMEWNTPGSSLGGWRLLLSPGAPALIKLQAFDTSGVEQLGDSGANFTDTRGTELFGTTVYFTVTATQNGTGLDWAYTFYRYGTEGSGSSGTEASTSVANVTAMYVVPGAGLDGVTVGHMAVSTDVNFGAGFDGSDGFAGETTDTRWARLGSEENLPWARSVNASALMGAQPTASMIDQIREIGVAEGVPMFEKTTGFLYLPARSERYNQAVALTLDFDGGTVGEPPEPTDDDQQLVNDATVSRSGGSSARSTRLTGTNSTAVGVYPVSQQVNTFDDTTLPDRAAWLVHLGTVDLLRFPRVSLNLARAPQIATAWLACDINSRIQMLNPPPQLPPDTIDLLIEGYTEVLGPKTWTVDANCSPAEPWDVWKLEDDNNGRLDSQGSELLVGVTSAATSWLVATTTATGQPNAIQWSTTAEPYYWWVAGEKVRADTVNTNAAQFIAAGTAQHGNNASVTPSMPAGVTAGDLLLVFAAIRNSGTGTVNTPTGYTQLLSFGNMALLGKIHTGTESAPTITFTGGVANADTSAQMAAFRYTQLSVVSSATQLNGSAQDIATPALSGIDRGRMVILYLGWKQDDWTSVASPGTEIGEPDTTTGDDQGIVWSYTIQTTPAAISSTSFVVTGGAAAISRGAVVALKGDVQSCTVTRSINGVTKAQATGTDVSLWRPETGGLAL